MPDVSASFEAARCCVAVRFVSVHFKLSAQAVGFSFGSSFVSSRFGALCFPRLALMFLPFFIYFFFLSVLVCVFVSCFDAFPFTAEWRLFSVIVFVCVSLALQRKEKARKGNLQKNNARKFE